MSLIGCHWDVLMTCLYVPTVSESPPLHPGEMLEYKSWQNWFWDTETPMSLWRKGEYKGRYGSFLEKNGVRSKWLVPLYSSSNHFWICLDFIFNSFFLYVYHFFEHLHRQEMIGTGWHQHLIMRRKRRKESMIKKIWKTWRKKWTWWGFSPK